MSGSEAVVNARILYWGVSEAGKSANLEHIHGKLRPDHRGDLQRVPTPDDPGAWYELLPIELGKISGVRTRLQIVAPPGGPEYGATRQQLMDQVDGIVFVLDARRDRIAENLAALEELRSQLERYGRRLEDVPVVLQYNRRDEADDLAVEELHRKIGLRAAAFEAIAPRGIGVLESLTTISKRVVRNRREAAGLTQPPGGQSLPPAPGVAPLAPPPPSDSLSLGSSGPKSPAPIADAESTLPEEEYTLPEGRALPEEPTLPEARGASASGALKDHSAVALEPEKTLPEAQDAPPDSMAQAIDVAARRAERLFDENWDEATGGVESRTGAAGPLVLRIVAAGEPELEEGHRLRVPLRLVDQDGRQGDCLLTLDLSALGSD